MTPISSSTKSTAPLLNALLALHFTPPHIISTPSSNTTSTHQSQYQTKSHPPAGTPIVGPARHQGSSRRASVAIIIRIRPSFPPSTPSTVSSAPTSPGSTPGSASPTQAHTPSSVPETSKLSPITSELPRPNSTPLHRIAPTIDVPDALRQFFAQPWVSTGQAEIFFIKRATRASDRWSAHLAFPGGRMEAEDEDGQFCALRETWEEVGIDLAERDFVAVGQLDDREITTSLGKRLLMVLSPYVFLSTRPAHEGPEVQLEPGEVASAYWVPLDELNGPKTRWGEVAIELSSRLAPTRHWILKRLLDSWVGSMHFQSVLIRDRPCAVAEPRRPSAQDHHSAAKEDLHLWGLTLGMSLDLVTFLTDPALTSRPFRPSPRRLQSLPPELLIRSPITTETEMRPSMTSIFPRFSHADINTLIWLLGSRYRSLVKRRARPGPALTAFYTAVRKALIVGMILRSMTALGLVMSLIKFLVHLRRHRLRFRS